MSVSAKNRIAYCGIAREGKRYIELFITREDGVQVSCVRTGRSWHTHAEAAAANEEINRPLSKSAAEIAAML